MRDFRSSTVFRLVGRIGLVLLSLTAGLVSCSKKKGETADVIVLQTGRLRGNVYPRALQSLAPLQHYLYLAGYIKQVREEAARAGARVVVVDLGDSMGGSFASYATGYGNMVLFFNEAGYDFVVLGNLDNSVPSEVLAKLNAEVLCPFTAPNGEPAVATAKFAARKEVSGLPVEVFANFYGDVPREKHPERFPTWFGDVSGNVEPVRDYAPIAAKLGARPPGTLALLSWMKFESPKDPPTRFLESLTQLGIDAILAHRIYSGRERDAWSDRTFYEWKPPVSENILRDNGGFTVARLDLKRDGDGWRVLRQELLPMTANTAPADPAIEARIAAFESQIRDADKPIADLSESIEADEILLGYLTALSQIPGTQVAAYSHQSIRSDWPEGPLTSSRVFNSLPWTTSVVQLTLTPGQLERLGKFSGMQFLRRNDAPMDHPVMVTTSRFFASLLAEELGLPPDAIRDVGVASEFDYYVDFLIRASKPLRFSVPEGWTFVPSPSR